MIEPLQKDWRNKLSLVIRHAKTDIFISSPFVTIEGAKFVLNSITDEFKNIGKFTLLSNLSPVNIIQGSTDPNAFQIFSENLQHFNLWHLPNLHAKVYISDKAQTIITSGNLTAGGLYNNFEYGVQIESDDYSSKIYEDLFSYSQLGSRIDDETLLAYSTISKEIKAT